MTSSSRISDRVATETWRRISFSRDSTESTSTLRRYFGQNTRWYLQEYTTLLLLLNPILSVLYRYSAVNTIRNYAPFIPIAKARGIRRVSLTTSEQISTFSERALLILHFLCQ